MTTISGQCIHCTVPTENGDDTCAFCSDYAPPTPATVAALLADASVAAHHAAEDTYAALNFASGDVPLMAAADLSSAVAHLRAARRLITRAASTTTGTDGGDH